VDPDREPTQDPTLASGRLEAWLAANVAGFRGPVRLAKFAGGQSNPTYKVSAASGDYVLRRKPLGLTLPKAHAVDREYRVLSALSGAGIPLPKVHALCRDDGVIGSMFYVMDMVEGRTFWDPRLPELSRTERGAVFASMNQVIADIHSIDPAAVGLGDFGRSENYLQRQITLWTKQYRAAETAPNPAVERLIQWLPDNVPAEHPARIVHGDYRLDNVLIHPTEPRVVAVLDWELATIGNPIADFAYHALTWRFAPELFRGLAGEDLASLGIPGERQYLDTYLARTGLAPPRDWEFYLILSMFRIVGLMQGIAKRALDGTATNENATAIGAKAVPISQLAWSMVAQREA
jgi:aminoglycoside phosphotransferase (APT) family kinase protein